MQFVANVLGAEVPDGALVFGGGVATSVLIALLGWTLKQVVELGKVVSRLTNSHDDLARRIDNLETAARHEP